MTVQGFSILNTGFNGMAYGGYYHQLYSNGNINQSFQSYDAQTNTLEWSLPYGGGGLPQYTGVFSDGKKPYVCFYSGNVVSYSEIGTIDKTYTNTNVNYYPVYFNTFSTYNAGIYKDKFSSTSDKIICYLKNGGAAVNSNYTPCNVTAIFEHTSDELYVLGNDATNNAVLYLYSVSTNVFAGPLSLPSGKLLSAVQIDPDYLALASESGTIYGYRYSNGNTLALASIKAQKLIYKAKMYELTAASKNTLYVYSVSGNYSLGLSNTHVLSDSIIGFEVVTNK